jgi:hypothetical protein
LMTMLRNHFMQQFIPVRPGHGRSLL